jgi:hypothetical protein
MNYTRQTITAPGGAFTSTASMFGYEAFEMYTSGVVTLTGSVSITTSSTLDFQTFNIRWNANVLLGIGFSVTICGITITQDQLNQTGMFTCVYDGLAWNVQYYADGKDQPQIAQGVKSNTVPASGPSLVLTAGVDAAYQRLKGPVTLITNYAVSALGGVKAGSQFQVEIEGGITLATSSLTVFGIIINKNQALNGGVIITATYDGLNWVGVSTSRPVTTADIEPVAAWSVMGNATSVSAAPTDITFSTNYGVLQRSGSTLTTSLLTPNNFDTSLVVLNKVSVVNLTSAQILALGTTPVVIVPASGVNTVNVISSITVTCTFVTTPYDTSTNISAYYAAGTISYFVGIDLLGFTSSGISKLYSNDSATQQFQLVANAPILLQADLGDPLTGNGTIKVTVVYQTINS